jgi:transcriptional regulator with XRE-family HTH domain
VPGTRSSDAAGAPGPARRRARSDAPVDPGDAGASPDPDVPGELADVTDLDGGRPGTEGDPLELLGGAGSGPGDLGSFIREQRRRGRLSLRKLSELSGISNPYLSQIERGLRRPSAEILQQVARALHISVESLYVRAGILDPSPGSASELSVVAAVQADPDLDDEQRRALLHIYDSFVRAGRSRHPDPAGHGPDPSSRTA